MTQAQLDLHPVLRHIHRLVGPKDVRDLTDAQLVQRFVACRDEAAFAALVQRHRRLVWGVCRRVLRHDHDAEDAFQATFLTLARHAGSLRRGQAVAAWLYQVAYRIALKAGAQRAKRQERERQAGTMAHQEPGCELAWRELQAILDEELVRLAEKYRAPFVLCCLEGKSKAEAARQLGWKEGTVSGRLAEARRLLRKRLARRGVTLSAVLCALELSQRAGAAVRAAVVEGTVKSAAAYAAGGSADGLISVQAAALAQGMTRAMLAAKVKFATALLLAVGLVFTSAGVLAHQALASKPGATLDVPAANPSAPAAQPPAAKEEAVRPLHPAADDDKGDSVEVKGCVVGPDGKPVAGARLYLNYYSPKEQDRPVRATSGDDGRFRFTFKRSEFDPSAPGSYGFSVLAAADGYAPDWVYRGPQAKEGELTLRLVRDLPIEGRVLDLDGRPIKGATLRLEEITAYEDVEAFLQTVRDREWPLVPSKTWFGPFPGQPKVLTTGADGRFKLIGVGGDRKVQFHLEGPGIQYGPIRALAREMKAPVEPRPAKRFEEGRQIQKVYGATFEHVAAPSRPIRGVVRDKKTGQPVAGVELRADGSTHRTQSDAAGRYELLGCPKSAEGYRVSATPTGQLYFSTGVRFADTPGLGPIQGDIELVSGILVKGRVTHRVTGKPIAEAGVHYNPLYPNPFDRLFGPDGAGAVPCSSAKTQADGSYSLVVLPGPGVLGVMARSPTETFMPALLTAQELRDFLGREEDHNDEDMLKIQAGGNSFTVVAQTEFNHLLLINPGEKDETLTRDVALQPARPFQGKVIGPDGKPLARVTVYNPAPGILSQPLTEDTFTVEGLNPRRPHHLVFLDKDRKLGAFVTILSEMKEPLTVRLDPCGSVTGRLLDDGQPAVGVTVRLDPEQLHYHYIPAKVKTDATGRFRIEGLVPGQKYQARLGPGPFGQYLFAPFTLKPGESKDLGDCPLKPSE